MNLGGGTGALHVAGMADWSCPMDRGTPRQGPAQQNTWLETMFRKKKELAVNYENPEIVYFFETKSVGLVRSAGAPEKRGIKNAT